MYISNSIILPMHRDIRVVHIERTKGVIQYISTSIILPMQRDIRVVH